MQRKLRIFYSRHHPNGDADSALREQLPQWPGDCELAISQRRAKLFGTYQLGGKVTRVREGCRLLPNQTLCLRHLKHHIFFSLESTR